MPLRTAILHRMLPELAAIAGTITSVPSQWGVLPGLNPDILLSLSGRICNLHSVILGSIWYPNAVSLKGPEAGPFPPIATPEGNASLQLSQSAWVVCPNVRPQSVSGG